MQPRAARTIPSLCLASLFAASEVAASSEGAPENPPRSARAIGLTVDLLPIALSASAGQLGASGQVWAGLTHARLRLVAARIAFPDWLAGKDGFEQQRTSVGAVLVDYVFGDHFDKWWLGSGFEYWHSSIGHRDFADARTSWNTPVWTLGGGYIAPIVGNFCIEPWAAGHVAVTDASPSIGGQTYRPQRVNGEVSLKLGVFFDL
jgi:hypothetical protein